MLKNTHLFLVDLKSLEISGKDAEESLGRANIHLNRNAIPYDQKPPRVASGLRIGTAAVTSRGFGNTEMITVGNLITRVLTNFGDQSIEQTVKEEVAELSGKFPVPGITSLTGYPFD